MVSAGEFVRAADIDEDAWTSYTPTWGSTGTAPAIGNGTIVGRYKLLPNSTSKTCAFSIEMILGGTSTVGTGVYTWTTPFTAGSQTMIIPGILLDSGTGFYTIAGEINASGTTITRTRYTVAGASAALSATAPVVPASGDTYRWTGIYEIA